MSATMSRPGRPGPGWIGEPGASPEVSFERQPDHAVTEDFTMLARKAMFSRIGRGAAMAGVAAMALTMIEPLPARADPVPSGKGASVAASHGTDISSRRRVYRGGGGGAAAAAFAGIVGTGIAIAAAQNRRSYYDDYYGGGGPVYYGGGPVYYGGYGSSVPYFHGHPNPGW
jgi:hypothetical protein